MSLGIIIRRYDDATSVSLTDHMTDKYNHLMRSSPTIEGDSLQDPSLFPSQMGTNTSTALITYQNSRYKIQDTREMIQDSKI